MELREKAMNEKEINDEIKLSKSLLMNFNEGRISDGYHTFDELYEHRITLYMAICKICAMADYTKTKEEYIVWRSERHSDGSSWDGWFILGIGTEAGKQITYHLPIQKWDECGFAIPFDKAPQWDGHTSNDVLERLKKMF